ncbi:uncharacterized protein LOC143253253 isoform X2 [Tachypleus tridentatus]|uniref:uncharacterized protein LOC143253253 isoform X2 n=1 Tax=Tachypleus tridentatus TaxID=6853 RepID=UPI003FD4434E
MNLQGQFFKSKHLDNQSVTSCVDYHHLERPWRSSCQILVTCLIQTSRPENSEMKRNSETPSGRCNDLQVSTKRVN